MLPGSHSQSLEPWHCEGPGVALSHMISAVWLPAGLKIRFDESKVLQSDVNCQPVLEGMAEGAGWLTFCRLSPI